MRARWYLAITLLFFDLIYRVRNWKLGAGNTFTLLSRHETHAMVACRRFTYCFIELIIVPDPVKMETAVAECV
jgi:hypothetical protein